MHSITCGHPKRKTRIACLLYRYMDGRGEWMARVKTIRAKNEKSIEYGKPVK